MKKICLYRKENGNENLQGRYDNVEEAQDTVKKLTEDEVTGGDTVTIRGFGTFQTKQRKAKPARNINTGETLLVPARKVVVFKPSKDFNADRI